MAGVASGKSRQQERLKSWKEIATFFGTDERTVRRWEERGLPVRRVPGGARPTIYADVDELKAWLGQRREDMPEARPSPPVSTRARWWLLASAGSIVLLAAGAATLRMIPERMAKESLAHPAHQPSQRALELYLAGTYDYERRTAQSLARARDLFGQAIAEDPDYAAAYAGLADTYLLLREYAGMPQDAAYERARAAAGRALALDQSLAQAHAALAFVTFYHDRDWTKGLRGFERAIALEPDSARARHWYATALLHTGRMEQARAAIREAQARDPQSRAILADKELIIFHCGRVAEAKRGLLQLAESEPEFLSPHLYLAMIATAEADDAVYLREARRSAELLGDPYRSALLDKAADGLARSGHQGMLRAILSEQQRLRGLGRRRDLAPVGTTEYALAGSYALLGDRDQAVIHLGRSVAARESDLLSIRVDPMFGQIQGDPRFRAIVDAIGRAG